MQPGELLKALLLPVVRNGTSSAEKYAGAGKSFPEAIDDVSGEGSGVRGGA